MMDEKLLEKIKASGEEYEILPNDDIIVFCASYTIVYDGRNGDTIAISR